MQRQTFSYSDKREYSVTAALAGTVKITDASHPTSVTVNVEFPWYVVGHVENAAVRNPGVAYWYKDGPAASLSLVRKDGTEVNLPKGSAMIVYYHADKDVCTNVDSRYVFKGAKLPTAGTYTIWLLAGTLSEDEAAAGVWSLAGMKEHVTGSLRGFAGFPVFAEAAVEGAKVLSILAPFGLAGLILLATRR